MSSKLLTIEIIQNKIYAIRGQKVMLDRDLAKLYGVLTKALNQAVRRNVKRFPEDFYFQLTKSEKDELVTNCDQLEMLKHSTSNPYVFTEQGIAMLSSVLNSEKAIEVNIKIMRVFTKLREMMLNHKDLALKIERLENKVGRHDKEIQMLFNNLRRLMDIPIPTDKYKRTKVGFITEK